MPNGYNNLFDIGKLLPMLGGMLQNGNSNVQSPISNMLGQSVLSLLNSAFAPGQNNMTALPPAANQNPSPPPPQAPAAPAQQQYGIPGMQNLVMQMIQMMLFPPRR